MLDKMKASHFVKKYSVQFVNASGKLSAPFYFHDNKPHECSQTWQVVRSEFDMMMLDNAREHGVEVHRGRRACWRCCSRATGRVGVRVQKEDGTQEEVRAKVVVDASGQSTMLQNRFKLRLWDPVLNKGAIWTYWEGAYRDTGRDEGATHRHPDAEQAGLVVVHPAARRHHQRRRRRRRSTTCSRAAAATSRPTTRKSSACPAVKERLAERRARRPATSPPRITPTARSRWPATAGC